MSDQEHERVRDAIFSGIEKFDKFNDVDEKRWRGRVICAYVLVAGEGLVPMTSGKSS